MKTSLLVGVLLAALAVGGVSLYVKGAEPSAYDGLAKDVATLNESSKAKLGVGIIELGLLAQAKRGAIFSESGLRGDNRLGALTNLEAQGYVNVFRRPSSDDTWIEITPTKKGQVVFDFFRGH